MSAKKKPAKTAGKSAQKSVVGRPLTADDPRRGRGPAKGAPNAGRPPDAFKALMRELASRDESLVRLAGILKGTLKYTDGDGKKVVIPVDSDTYLKALAFASDRGYGKAQQSIDVTSGGKPIADVLKKARERVAQRSDA